MWSKLDSTQVLYYIEDEGFNCRRIRALETQKLENSTDLHENGDDFLHRVIQGRKLISALGIYNPDTYQRGISFLPKEVKL